MSSSRRDFLSRSLALGTLGCAFLRDDWLARVEAAQKAAGDEAPEKTAGNESFWFQIQQAFAVDRSIINLNNGGVSPAPRMVLDAMRRHMDFTNNIPARNLWSQLDPQVETVRARLARTFGCDAEEMAITRNSSESLEICIYGIDLKPGDEVLTSAHDYPRMINTWKQREQREGIKLKLIEIPCPADGPDQLYQLFADNVTPKTKVILCSHVVNVTGQVYPVKRIVQLGRERGIPVIVDGAHAFAHLVYKRDDLGCDYYGTSLHKWLTTPIGCGFLYVRKDKIESLWPLMAAPEPRGNNIRKFEEIGTHPTAPYLAIADAITFFDGIGAKRKFERMRYLRDRWARRLTQDKRVSLLAKLDAENSGGVATFIVQDIDPGKLVEHLWSKHHIFTISVSYANVRGIRVTPNVYTAPEEIDLFSEAVENVLANGLPG